LIEAWASHKSFGPKDGSGKPPEVGGDVDFRGEKRKNQTHESTTDPDARLFTKSSGSQAKLSYMGHVLMENRNGLLLQTFLSEASGRAERDAALLMVEALPAGKRVTLGGDKNYDTREFVRELRGMNITPHVAQNTNQAPERGGRANCATCGVRGESAAAETGGAIVRVDEDDRDAKESEVARDRESRVAVYLHRSCLQPVSIAKPDGQNMKRNIVFGLAR
jgi:DDE family transposase